MQYFVGIECQALAIGLADGCLAVAEGFDCGLSVECGQSARVERYEMFVMAKFNQHSAVARFESALEKWCNKPSIFGSATPKTVILIGLQSVVSL